MDVLIAIAHIGGSIVALVVFGIVVLLIGAWEMQRNQRHALEDASIQLGVAVEELDNEEFAPKLIQLSSSRYSRELLRNRLSDLCGALRTVWGWLGLLLQCAILIAVVWYTFTDSLGTAVHAWWIVAVAVVFWMTAVVFALVCRLFTGRYPGEAKQARKSLAKVVSERRVTRETDEELYGDAT